MKIKVHCKKCHAEWNVAENLDDVIDIDECNTYVNETRIYTCPNCHNEIECTVSFDKIPCTIMYY